MADAQVQELTTQELTTQGATPAAGEKQESDKIHARRLERISMLRARSPSCRLATNVRLALALFKQSLFYWLAVFYVWCGRPVLMTEQLRQKIDPTISYAMSGVEWLLPRERRAVQAFYALHCCPTLADWWRFLGHCGLVIIPPHRIVKNNYKIADICMNIERNAIIYDFGPFGQLKCSLLTDRPVFTVEEIQMLCRVKNE